MGPWESTIIHEALCHAQACNPRRTFKGGMSLPLELTPTIASARCIVVDIKLCPCISSLLRVGKDRRSGYDPLRGPWREP